MRIAVLFTTAQVGAPPALPSTSAQLRSDEIASEVCVVASSRLPPASSSQGCVNSSVILPVFATTGSYCLSTATDRNAFCETLARKALFSTEAESVVCTAPVLLSCVTARSSFEVLGANS